MTLKEALRSRRFWWMYAACVLAAPAMFIPFAHVSAAARDLGIGDARAVGLVGLIGVGSIVGRFAIGGLADRLGRIASIALLEASLGACYLLWLGAGGYLALAVFALWLGLSYGGIVSLMPAICMDLFGARAVSSILGTLYSGAAFGNLLGPVVAGAVFDRTGSYVPVIWACFVLAILSAIASAQLLRDRRPTLKDSEESAPPLGGGSAAGEHPASATYGSVADPIDRAGEVVADEQRSVGQRQHVGGPAPHRLAAAAVDLQEALQERLGRCGAALRRRRRRERPGSRSSCCGSTSRARR